MNFTTSLNASLNDWLVAVAAGRKEALKRGARRFTALVSATPMPGTLELPHAEGADAPPAVALKITAGLHRGAFMTLTGSEYLVGSGDDCDVVLRDEAVSAHHFRLRREWSGFCVQDLRTRPPQLVTPQTVAYEGGAIEAGFAVGGVHFTLRQAPPPSQVGAGREARKQPASPALLVVIILGLASAILTVVGAERAVTQPSTDFAQWSGAGDHALAARGFSSVHFVSDLHGDAQVKGLVADLAEKQRLQAWLRGSPYSKAHLDVQVISDLIEQVRRALADETLKVGLHDARLNIEGRTSRPEMKARIHALTQDLRGTVPIEDRVQYVDAHDYSPGPLPVTVSSVMVGDPSYFLTDEGTRYFVGGQMPDGAEVAAIDASQIQFRLRGKLITYRLE